MKKNIFIFVCLIALFSCDDEDKLIAPDANPLLEGNIKGLVLDSITEEPIAGAFVSTYPLTSTTETLEDGSFELPSVSPDVYDILITHPDYRTYTQKIKVSNQITNDILFSMASFFL